MGCLSPSLLFLRFPRWLRTGTRQPVKRRFGAIEFSSKARNNRPSSRSLREKKSIMNAIFLLGAPSHAHHSNAHQQQRLTARCAPCSAPQRATCSRPPTCWASGCLAVRNQPRRITCMRRSVLSHRPLSAGGRLRAPSQEPTLQLPMRALARSTWPRRR